METSIRRQLLIFLLILITFSLERKGKFRTRDIVTTPNTINNVVVNALTVANPNFPRFYAYVTSHLNKLRRITSAAQIDRKFARFVKSYEHIMQHNNDPSKKFKLKLNKFADMSDAKIKAHMGYIPPPTNVAIKTFLQKVERKAQSVSLLKQAQPPIDWRLSGYVSPVDDQGNCGLCWAFAGAGMLESFYAINNKKPLQTISRQEFNDCLTTVTGNPGSCNGGNFFYAAQYGQKVAVSLNSNYAYTGAQGICASASQSVKVGPLVSNAQLLATVSAMDLYKLLQSGPVAVNIDSTPKEFLYYSSGIMNYICLSANPTHAVLVVGYGVSSDGTQFWIIKNSWGTDWGEGGYGRLNASNWTGCYIYTNVVKLTQ
jgi:C1A family cysteine protease